jgi:hypothetical protein
MHALLSESTSNYRKWNYWRNTEADDHPLFMMSISGNWRFPNSNSWCLHQKQASHRIFLQKFDGKWYKYTWWFLSATQGCREAVPTTCMNLFSTFHLFGWSFFPNLFSSWLCYGSPRITQCSLLIKNLLFEICMITCGHFVTFIVVGSATVWLGFLSSWMKSAGYLWSLLSKTFLSWCSLQGSQRDTF